MIDPFAYRVPFIINTRNSQIYIDGAIVFSNPNVDKKKEKKVIELTHKFIAEAVPILNELHDKIFKKNTGEKEK